MIQPLLHQDIFHQQLSQELYAILDWWRHHTVDETYGGFIGQMDGHGVVHPQADKGIILNTRILWTFSAAARHADRPAYRQLADRAFRYLLDHFRDAEAGGFFWMLDYRGQPIETKKQVYAQAFAVYALSEYYLLTQQPEALEAARQTFALIERHSLDPTRNGYLDAFSRDWQLLDDLRLSAKDANAAKTMNTHLHLLEAYTNLLRAGPDAALSQALENLLDLFTGKFIDQHGHLQLFFDENWRPQSDLISFGHDIECSWLLLEAAEVLGDADWLEKVKTVALRIAEATLAQGVDTDGALFNEANAQVLHDTDKHWWPQAEAVVGFLSAWDISGQEKFYAAATQAWQFIQHYLLDVRLGEWRWRVDRAGVPDLSEDKVSQWKCPYHNGRACLEGMRRLGGKGQEAGDRRLKPCSPKAQKINNKTT